MKTKEPLVGKNDKSCVSRKETEVWYWRGLILVTFLAFATRFYKIEEPDHVW